MGSPCASLERNAPAGARHSVGVGPGVALLHAALAPGPLRRPPRHVRGGGIHTCCLTCKVSPSLQTSSSHVKCRLLQGIITRARCRLLYRPGIARLHAHPIDTLHGDIDVLFPKNVLLLLSKFSSTSLRNRSVANPYIALPPIALLISRTIALARVIRLVL